MKKIVIFISVFIFIIPIYIQAETGVDAEARQVEEKTIPFKMGGHIFLEGNEGRITIQAWDNEEVRLVMTKRAWGRTRSRAERNLERIEVRIEQRGDRIYIRDLTEDIIDEDINFFDLFKPSTWKYRGCSVDFDLTVPRNVNFEISNDEGNIDISDVNGDIRLEIDEGDVEMFNVSSDDINVYVDEGDIYVTDFNIATDSLKGVVDLRSDEGKIKIKNCNARSVIIDSDEGDIILYNVTALRMNIYTDEGDIENELNVVLNGNYRIRTEEGDVFVLLSKNPDIQLDLETLEGNIRTDFDLYFDKDDDAERARGTIGKGSAFMILKTAEGSITLEEKW